jgi:hypothetical protein
MWQFSAAMALMLERIDPNTSALVQQAPRRLPPMLAGRCRWRLKPDMVVRVEIQDTRISCGDISAVLTGQISGGPSIISSSSIRTVRC